MLLSVDNGIIEQLKEFNERMWKKIEDLNEEGKKKMIHNEEERWRQIEALYARVTTELNTIGYQLDYQIHQYVTQQLHSIQQVTQQKAQTIHTTVQQCKYY